MVVLNSHPNKCLGKMLLCDFSLSSQWLDQLVPHPQPKFPAAACNLFIIPSSVPPPTSSPRFPSLGRAFSTPRLCFPPHSEKPQHQFLRGNPGSACSSGRTQRQPGVQRRGHGALGCRATALPQPCRGATGRTAAAEQRHWPVFRRLSRRLFVRVVALAWQSGRCN